ncbi:MAG: LPS export ABC transporter ATP-binding protein [Gammaproteobacteria bacterium]|nr:LPS export ABC transporter ATP-binding protein [Gammaproteobacteria bacterium]NNM01179.1 LPS export ABC transporter ATP-binding protein [Gammaproteobacteria bacterium]
MSVLVTRNLAKSFRKRRVVKDVSLSVASGEVIGLLGPNGAGKTTSFNMIVGLLKADAGSIMLDSVDLTRLPMDRRARAGIGYLPQEASVFRKLTVAENIMAVMEARRELSPEVRERRLTGLLERFHIVHLRDSLGVALSGGERRRLEIARTLATDPRIILLDEPFAGVDPISVVEIQKIIAELSELGIGVLITDHNVQETLRICDRAYIVNDGELIAEGTAEEIVNNEQVRSVYLGEQFTMQV